MHCTGQTITFVSVRSCVRHFLSHLPSTFPFPFPSPSPSPSPFSPPSLSPFPLSFALFLSLPFPHHTATPTLFFTLTHTCKARTCQTTVWSKIKELDWNEMKWNKGTRPMLFRFSSFHFVRFVRALSECWTNFKMHYRLWFNTLFPRWPTVGRVASTVVGLVTFDCTRGLSTGYFTIQTVLST